MLMGGLEYGPSLSKTCGNMLCGLLEDGQQPHGLLRHGLCMCSGSYQAVTKQFLAFLMIRLAV